MQIDSSGTIASFIQGAKEGQQGQQQAAEQADTAPNTSTDKVTLTNTASQLQHVDHALENHPVVNSQRVEQVQSAVNEGTLSNNVNQVADKLLSFENALNGARTGT